MIQENSSYEEQMMYISKLKKERDYYKDMYKQQQKTLEDINLEIKAKTSTYCELMQGEYKQ